MIQNGNVEIMQKITEADLAEMLVVPEDVVTLCSDTMVEAYGSDTENNFSVVLKKGAILKEAGRTPIYLCTQDMTHIYVTSVEKLKKQYN
jgi:hypothetical protein